MKKKVLKIHIENYNLEWIWNFDNVSIFLFRVESLQSAITLSIQMAFAFALIKLANVMSGKTNDDEEEDSADDGR